MPRSDNHNSKAMDEIDLDEELSSGLLAEGTQKSYNVYLRKSAEFYHDEFDGKVVANEHLTDENMATFLVKLYKEHAFKPYIKKTACAALGFCLRFHGRPTFSESPHLYPWVTKALDVIDSVQYIVTLTQVFRNGLSS